MNLREEIYNLLDESARVKAGYYTDEILKLVEKKIDSIKPMEDEEYLAGHVTFRNAIEKMKEMLK